MRTNVPNDNGNQDATRSPRPVGPVGPRAAAGTSEPLWRRALDRLPEQGWPPRAGGQLVVVAPHPDDESLGVGGLIHMCLNAGWRVEIISVTDGDAAYGEANQLLGKRRLREQARASEALGGEAPSRPIIHRVGLPDGDVAAHEAELEDELTDLLLGADWCFATSRQDGHPDHEAAGRAAAAAAKGVGIPSAEYPIWAWEWRTPDSFPLDRAVRVALPASSRAAKASAIAEHASQLLPYGDGTDAVLPPDVLSHFDRPFEVLLLP